MGHTHMGWQLIANLHFGDTVATLLFGFVEGLICLFDQMGKRHIAKRLIT